MSLFVSLFGGMLATALLYGLGRRLRLSNFWSAVGAAGITSVAYALYVVARRPGLDVITLHLVAYPTVALLLYQLYGDKVRHARAIHWVPKLLLGFFAVLTVLYGAFIYIAGHGLPPALAAWLLPGAEGRPVYTGFAGVVEHDQAAAKGIAQHLKMEERLARLGWRLEVSGLNDVRADRPQPVTVHVYDRNGNGVDGIDIRLSAGRPGQSAPPAMPLEGDGSAGYHTVLPPLQAGSWVAYLTLHAADGSPIQLEHTLVVR